MQRSIGSIISISAVPIRIILPIQSIHSNSTLEDLSKNMNKPLDQRRFRGNIWLNGETAWSEFDWIGKIMRIGTAEIEIMEPIDELITV
jgi:hypothetical protein